MPNGNGNFSLFPSNQSAMSVQWLPSRVTVLSLIRIYIINQNLQILSLAFGHRRKGDGWWPTYMATAKKAMGGGFH